MKIIIKILLYIFFLPLFSQNNELFEENWFLTQVHINGSTHDRPITNDSFSNTYFPSSQNKMFTTICVSGGIIANLSVDTNTSEIIFSDFEYYPGDCTNGNSIDFREAFFEFFEEINGVVNYSVTTGGDGVKSLLLENNDNWVSYKNSLNLPPEEILLGNWHLLEITINGTTHQPPANEEVPYIAMSFDENNSRFYTSVCASTTSFADFYTEDSLFFLTEMEGSAMECEDPDNQDFQNIYFSFFWDNNLNAYTYTYENAGEEETFIIYDTNGNEAVYVKQLMSLADVLDSSFLIFPNPGNGVITIANTHSDIFSYEVYNVAGQVVNKGTIESPTTRLDFSNNQAGVYFIRLQDTQSKSVVTKKLVIK